MADDYFANYWRDKVNDHLFGGSPYTRPSTYFFVAMSTLATPAGGGVAAAGFSPLSVTTGVTSFTTSSGQQCSNAIAFSFGNNSGGTVTVVGIAFFDGASPQNQLGQGALTTPITVPNGGPLTIPIGGLVLGWAP